MKAIATAVLPQVDPLQQLIKDFATHPNIVSRERGAVMLRKHLTVSGVSPDKVEQVMTKYWEAVP